MSWEMSADTTDVLSADTTDVLSADTTDVLSADTTDVLSADTESGLDPGRALARPWADPGSCWHPMALTEKALTEKGAHRK